MSSFTSLLSTQNTLILTISVLLSLYITEIPKLSTLLVL